MSKILKLPGFLSDEELAELADIDANPPEGHIDVNVKSLPHQDIITNIRLDAKHIMRDVFQADLHTDYMAYTQLHDGDSVVEHIDNMTLDGKPNASPYRSHTAMVYLNSAGKDFDGGTLMFPKLVNETDYAVPTAGMLVGFSCDLNHLVTPVMGGTRKAIAIWFSEDPKRERYDKS